MPAVTVIQIRRGTTAQWSAANPILAEGELGLDTTVDTIKIGDGATVWGSLPTSNILVSSNDSRLSDARTPTAHASTHAAAGSDPVTLSASQVSGVAVLASDNTFTNNTNTLVAGTGATKLVVKQGATQSTTNLQEWQNSGGTPLASIDSVGRFNSTTAANLGGFTAGIAFLGIQTSPTIVGSIIRGASSQTTDVLQTQTSAAVVNAGINPVGQTYVGSAAPLQSGGTLAIGTQTPTGTTNISITTATHGIFVGQQVTIAGVTPAGYNGTWTAQAGTTGTTLVVNIGSNPGAITVAGTVTSSATLSVSALSTRNTPIVVKGLASQAVNLLEVQNSTGASQFTVTPTGGLLVYQPSQFQTFTTTNTPLKVVGASNQTVDLLQIQNSASTTTAGVSSVGQIYTGSTGVKMGSTSIAINTQTPTGTTLISITTASTHGIQVGQSVTIAGITPAGYNGLWFAQAGTTGSTLVINIGSNPGAITVAGTVTSSAQLSVIAPTAYTTPLVVQGAASQATNFFEVQNSTGSVLASVTSSGTVIGTSVVSSAGTIRANNGLGSSNTALTSLVSNVTTGHIVMQNQATAPVNGVGAGTLYVDTGALKYVGTSGSAATIVNANGTLPTSSAIVPNFRVFPSGNYFTAKTTGGTSSSILTMTAIPFWLSTTTTFTKIGTYVSSAGSASAFRLGIWNNDAATDLPSTLLADYGTVSTTTTGFKEITGQTITLSAGLWWIGGVNTGAPGATVSATSTGSALYPIPHSAAPTSTTQYNAYSATYVSGTLPTFVGATTPATQGFLVWLGL